MDTSFPNRRLGYVRKSRVAFENVNPSRKLGLFRRNLQLTIPRPRTMGKIRKILTHRIAVQIYFFVFITLYALMGAFIFRAVEGNIGTLYENPPVTSKVKTCLNKKIKKSQMNDVFYGKVSNCFKKPIDQADWSLGSGLLFAFTVISTIGYGHVSPVTVAGRVVFMVYALIGIPLTLIYLANIGKFLMELAKKLGKKLQTVFWRCVRCCRKKKNQEEDEEKEASTGFIFVVGFILYTILGTFLLPLYEHMRPFEAFYFIFVTLTSIGFGDYSPQNYTMIILSLIYISIGLAITTIAIESMSEFFMKLHYFGRKMENMGQAEVWFGGQKVTVEELLDTVAQAKGITISADDLEDLVANAVEAQEEKKEDKKKHSAKQNGVQNGQNGKANGGGDKNYCAGCGRRKVICLCEKEGKPVPGLKRLSMSVKNGLALPYGTL